MDFVLDASVAAAWVLEDEQSNLADQIIDSLATKTAVAPHLWALETSNILLVAERRGRIDSGKRKLMIEAIRDLGVIEEPQPQRITFGAVQDLAAKHLLSSYDASYLELAVRLGLPLATLDQPLRKAAMQENVPLVESV
ncbi:MAG: type II toxin-antitoxin system VapC family toxin [Verrucomicrobiales bacterium]